MLKLFFEERKRRCKKLRVGIRKRNRITLDLLKRSLSSGSIPLILTNAKHFSDDEEDNLPHWIVVTGVDTQRLYINNPLAPRAMGGRITVPGSSFRDILGFKGDQCMVEVGRYLSHENGTLSH